MTKQPETFPLQQLRKYPHMLPADAQLWTRYLETNPFPAAHVRYDVHVGTPAPVPEGTGPNYARMIQALSTKRIDALVILPDKTLVVEVKPHAGATAVGQALCYALLYRQENPLIAPPTPTILTDTAQPDLPWICSVVHITLIELDKLLPE